MEPIQVENQPARYGAEPESRPNQEDPATPFLVGAKTEPMTRSASFYKKAHEDSKKGIQLQEAKEIEVELEIV